MDIAGQLASTGLNLVWTMGMVGGQALNQAITKSGRSVHNVSTLIPDKLAGRGMSDRDVEIAQQLIETLPKWKTGKVRIVTCVRDPLARNLQAFLRGKPDIFSSEDPQSLIDGFVRGYAQTIPLQWFGAEMAPVLGFDPLDHPFDKQRGWTITEIGNIRILVLRAEISVEDKKAALDALYGEDMPMPVVTPDSLPFVDVFGKVLDRVKFPQPLVSRFYDSRFVWHFWTYSQIDQMQKAVPVAAEEAQLH